MFEQTFENIDDILHKDAGHGSIHKIMDEKEALEVAEMIKPGLIISCY